MKSMIRGHGTSSREPDMQWRTVINECADAEGGQHDAARNKIPSPSDTRYARLPLRRLGGVLARRVDPGPAVLPRDGGEDQTLIRGHARPSDTSAAPAVRLGNATDITS